MAALVEVKRTNLTPENLNLFHDIEGEEYVDLLNQLAKNKHSFPHNQSDFIHQLAKIAALGIIDRLTDQATSRKDVVSYLEAHPVIAYGLIDKNGHVNDALIEKKKGNLTEAVHLTGRRFKGFGFVNTLIRSREEQPGLFAAAV